MITSISTNHYIIFVLAPKVITNDINLDYYYDFSQSQSEYKKVFEELNLEWLWKDITLENYKDEIEKATSYTNLKNKKAIFLNLCDGDEQNQTPGISVVHYLQNQGYLFTGANDYFYHITTSKVLMKKAFETNNVSTPKWFHIKNIDEIHSIDYSNLSYPIILKPSVSGGSIGVGIKNVVQNKEELIHQINNMFDGYRGWNLSIDGIIAEEFIKGEEYTVFIIGNYYNKLSATIYTPVQRVFHESLPPEEKFLSFDRLWEIYETESPMPNNDNFYEYAIASKNISEPLKEISWLAFEACKGTGYTRADIRVCNVTGKMYVLEVNAQCGISEDENFTSIGAILKASDISFTSVVNQILILALQVKNM